MDKPELPWSGEKVWKMKIFPGQGKVKGIWFESGKQAKVGKSQGISNFLSKPRCQSS